MMLPIVHICNKNYTIFSYLLKCSLKIIHSYKVKQIGKSLQNEFLIICYIFIISFIQLIISNIQAMKYGDLLLKCQQLINSYNSNIMTPDSHAQQFLTQLKLQDTQRVFLKQVFYGYERYKNFLQAFNNVIFNLKRQQTNRKNDATLFAIFTYLICFRMDQLPFNEFRKMVLSQDYVKMNVLLNFLFDFDALRDEVFESWSEHLELDYIENKLMPALAERKQKCFELINKVSEAATGKKADLGATQSMRNIDDNEKQKRKTTVPQEFNLTKPKPKLMPQPQKIEIGFKAKPAPVQKQDLKAIEEEKKKRREQIRNNMKKFYEENKDKDQFKLQTTKRPLNLPKLKEQVENQVIKQLKSKVTARPVPKFKQAQVKLNVAAILRQQKRLNEQIQEQEQRMKNLEVNMRDESEFESWKKQMKEKDQFEALQAQQRRKIQMQLAREAAMKAFEEKIEQKKSLVEDMKQIKQQLRRQRQKLQQQIITNKKKVVEQVQESRENVAIERQKIVQKNKKTAQQDKQERRRILEKKKEQEKIQMQKKKELIQQIKQLQKNIKAKPKQQIQYVSMGLLQEMNLEQLRKRLEEVKLEKKKEQEERRQSNIKKKEEFKTTINQKKNTIMAARQELAKQKQAQRIKKKQQVEEEKRRLDEVKVKSMLEYKKKEQQKVKQRQKEKEKLAKQIKQTEQRRMFLMQGQAAQQANAFLNLQKGQERELLDRQNQKLITEYKNQTIKQKDRQIIADANKKQVQSKIQFNKLYNERQDEANQMAEALRQEDQATRAMMFHEIKTYEQKHNENMAKSNPFKTKMAQTNLSKSKKA